MTFQRSCMCRHPNLTTRAYSAGPVYFIMASGNTSFRSFSRANQLMLQPSSVTTAKQDRADPPQIKYLDIPIRRTETAKRSFSYAAPSVWNSLPDVNQQLDPGKPSA